ncbi:MAG: ATP-dependent Clp protease ATP-binding subunit [Acidimicrobiia bacterium]
MATIERFTHAAQQALQSAQSLAGTARHGELSPLHLLAALAADARGPAGGVLERAGIDPRRVADVCAAELRRLPTVTGAEPRPGQPFMQVLGDAERAAQAMKDQYTSVEHLLLALASAQTPARQVLSALGADERTLRGAIDEIRKASGMTNVNDPNAEGSMEALRKYGIDLTEKAESGKLDPVIGRDEEIRRCMQVLSRRTKNNPVLIGEPGVGKTAVVEGLAQRIVNGDCPEQMKDVRIVALDVGQMLAGAKFQGEFEERLKAVIREVSAAAGRVILFIDEIHTVVSAGANTGSPGAGQLLKPALSRGELRTIGATTLDEYRQHIEKDPAFERRFQPVFVGEPSVLDTIAILRGLKPRYESHHSVRIQDGALVAAAQMSHRYISDRFLPDKAIDLVDEAASKLRIEIDSLPTEIDVVERRILQLDIERVALEKETDAASRERLDAIAEELVGLRARSGEMKTHWEAERRAIAAIRTTKEELEQARLQVERESDLAKAAEIRYGRIPELERRIGEATEALGTLQGDTRMLKEEVDAEDIAEVVSKWTGVPVTRLMEGEMHKLVRLEELLHQRVIGQHEAVAAVANAIRRSRAGLSDPHRPIGSFMFLGPTGVGKTELAKALAECLFDDERAMVRIDMSEYMEKHAVSRLVGAPPGYVGYDEGGQLTEAVRRRPYSVVLLDEIEKAHPEVFNVLLAVLDDGRLTDGQGRTVDFTNAVLIMTSNLPGEPIDYFKPEFVNRIDEIVRFRPLERGDMDAIVDIQLERLIARLAERRITLGVTPAARVLLADRGHDAEFGARPLKRLVQRAIADPAARLLLEGAIGEDGVIRVDVRDGEFTVAAG